MSRYKAMLLDAVNASYDHPTAEELFFAMKQQEPALVMATVYNNLNALVAEGKIRRIPVGRGSDRYDRTFPAHEHMVCDSCGRFADVTVPGLEKTLEAAAGVPINRYELEIHYTCKECRQRKAPANAEESSC